ncbi:carboxyl-terminal protease [Thermincola ferriacetica]|uniref:Carboxyl-terminal protease n=1 Tax=Thermincola ferriacetica TaxID=281456 RepID=A0A0L6VYT3_9FIRM|nr:S41 family peptidase [Thermincola ferriacetica]KNZ68482.1 carboxyl-terminal protease [Thermincola ferriacetica]
MKKLTKVLLFIFLIMCFIPGQNAAAYEATRDEQLDYLRSVFDFIKENYGGEIKADMFSEGVLEGIFGNLDPYTEYLSLKDAENFFNSIEGNYKGIGIAFVKTDAAVIITDVFSRSPADEAGIIAGDEIVAVDGQNIAGLSSDEISAMIKGPEGTKVKLTLKRNGQKALINLELTRSEIEINPVIYDIRGNIGYIAITTFNANTNKYFLQALSELDKRNIKKIILDLRDNPGGEVSQAVAVAENFVPAGLITKLDYKSEKQQDTEYYSNLKEKKYEVAVLVNGFTASASEILAGAIQDTKAGVLVGTKTFGKSKVQQMVPLLTPEAYQKYKKLYNADTVSAIDLMQQYKIIPADDEIIGWAKITIGEYFTPRGKRIDQVGLVPDVSVPDYKATNGIDVRNIQKLSKKTKMTLHTKSGEVYNAEKILILLGYNLDKPDTNLDAKTFAAIKKFQKDKGLYPYGVLDFITQQKLNEALIQIILRYDKQYAKAVELLGK